MYGIRIGEVRIGGFPYCVTWGPVSGSVGNQSDPIVPGYVISTHYTISRQLPASAEYFCRWIPCSFRCRTNEPRRGDPWHGATPSSTPLSPPDGVDTGHIGRRSRARWG